MRLPFLGAAVLAVPLITVDAQNLPFVTQERCRFTTFEEQSAFTRRFYSKDEFERAKNSPSIECLRIQYISDGLKVAGLVVKPRNGQAPRYPVIVYNRGGLLDIGKLDTPNILDFYELASQGFVILASQYRGNDGGEGREEFGGTDVDDVTNLLSIAATLPYADPKNILSALHKPYELVVYANDIHEAANNRQDRDARIVAWFKRFVR